MSIEVKNLRRSFGPMVAVANIDLSIPEGQMLVLLGPSGCGKTTTMRCIAGLETPNSGFISIAGRTVFDSRTGVDVPVYKRNVGMVFQSYAIWPHMTVFENVAFSLDMKGRPSDEIKSRVHDALALVGLAGLADRGSSALSGGQMQRVALARSIVMRPAVLLFDEPLSNLDARLRDRLRVELRELQTELKITAIYVTHDQQEALALADQIVVMEAGHIRQAGDPVSLYSNPKTATIAEFLGYTNVFDVTVADQTNGGCGVVLKNGGRLLHSAKVDASAGAELAICIRPDDISIKTLNEIESAQISPANVIRGEVTLASFMGTYMQYRVRSTDGNFWEISSRAIHPDVKRGSLVGIEIDPSHIRPLARR